MPSRPTRPARALTPRSIIREAGLEGRVGLGLPTAHTRQAPAPDVSSPQGPSLDALLGSQGHTASGSLIELSGEKSSGQTALAYRMAAGVTARGELVAWLDLPDALDPRFLRRSGVDLDALLWVRPPELRATLRSAEILVRTGFAMVAIDLCGTGTRALAQLPNSVWTRLLRAVRKARATAVLLSGPDRIIGPAATFGIYTERSQAIFDRALLEGLELRASIVRNRGGPTGGVYPFRILQRPAPPKTSSS